MASGICARTTVSVIMVQMGDIVFGILAFAIAKIWERI